MKKTAKEVKTHATSPRDHLTIVLKHKGENPRRSETARQLFDLYKSVKKVGEYRERAKTITSHYGAYFAEDIEHGFIELRGEGAPKAKAPETKAPKKAKSQKSKKAKETKKEGDNEEAPAAETKSASSAA